MVSGSNFSLDSACWVPEVRRNVEYQRHPSVRRLAGVLHSFFFFFFGEIYLFLGVLGLCCCSGGCLWQCAGFSQGMASLVEHRL